MLRDFVLGSLFMTLIELKIIKKKNKTVFQTISNVVKKGKEEQKASSEFPSIRTSLQSSAVCQEKVMFPKPKAQT